jgi:hypothetical protein
MTSEVSRMSGNGKVHHLCTSGRAHPHHRCKEALNAQHPGNWVKAGSAASICRASGAICLGRQRNSGGWPLPNAKGDHFADAAFF